MNKLANYIDTLNEKVGKSIAWAVLATTLITFLVVVLRKGFSWGSIAMQESALYFHALLFMVGAAYTLKHNGHVKVDIFYQNFSAKGRAWVNLLGTASLLLPFSLFILWISADYVLVSWQQLEGSRETGGLPLVFILKSFIPLMAILLVLQAIATMLRALSTLNNNNQESA
ncbi:MAG TPA: TRAP transporter small permease subunit [Thiothrix sp.]|nr:TRAP transporter small permease subunit [Thiothrix sp.]